MSTQTKRQISWVWWPFVAIWKLLSIIVEMTGRLLAMVIGIVLIIVGVVDRKSVV